MNARDVLGPMQAEAVLALVAEAVAELREELAAVAESWPAYMDVPTAARYCSCSEERIRKPRRTELSAKPWRVKDQ